MYFFFWLHMQSLSFHKSICHISILVLKTSKHYRLHEGAVIIDGNVFDNNESAQHAENRCIISLAMHSRSQYVGDKQSCNYNMQFKNLSDFCISLS